MEVLHYVTETLRVYPLFENENKNFKINKERGAVYNDFDFDSTELLSEYSSNITYPQTLVQDTNYVFSLNSDAVVPQMSIDDAVLEADKSNESLFDNALAFDHPDNDISSSTPDKEYLRKCADSQLECIKISTEVKNCLIFMKCDNWEGANSVYDAWLLSNNTPKKWFPYQKFINMFPEWEHQRLHIYNKENLEQCSQSIPIEEGMFNFNDTMTFRSEK